MRDHSSRPCLLPLLRCHARPKLIEIGLNPIQTDWGMMVLSSIVDITERKRVEAQRVELAAKDRALAAEDLVGIHIQ